MIHSIYMVGTCEGCGCTLLHADGFLCPECREVNNEGLFELYDEEPLDNRYRPDGGY